MPTNPFRVVDPATVPVRPVEQALLLIQFSVTDEIVVLDADRGEFVRLPSPPGWYLRADTLAADGRSVVVKFTDGRGAGGLLRYTLGTGDRRRIGDWGLGSLSPDGRTLIDVDGGDGPDLEIGLVDVATGDRRRLGAIPNAGLFESLPGWSPDGRFISLTIDVRDTEVAAMVLDVRTGKPLGRFPWRETLGCTHGSWLSEHELLLVPYGEDYESGHAIVDVTTGDLRHLGGEPPAWSSGLFAVFDGRLIYRVEGEGLYSTELDDTDPQPFVVIDNPRASVSLLEVAPFARRR